jgi:hypothetical protein
MNFNNKLDTILEAYAGQGLHPGLWSQDDRDAQLKPEIRKSLLKVATDFAKQHKIPQQAINDITITGSMANLNWSKYSDIDVHLVVDFTDIDENDELLRDYYNLAKSNWDDEHDITVCDHEVEVYVQDENEPHHSTGLYSIKNNGWLKEPKAVDAEKPSMDQIKSKAKKFIKTIDRLGEQVEEGDLEGIPDYCDKLKNKLKKMRKAGLEAAGEYSIENLTYKFLRNRGYIDKLYDYRTAAYDAQLSVDNC